MRTLNLSAYSETTPLAEVDLDFTTACNLRCAYCYKWDKGEWHLSREVAFDAVVWALHAASENKTLTIALMEGEPLLNFSFLKE
ncbi:MAG: hypothetical protein LBJ67_17265 [Planctomycetaceae bacterium]|jgi:sulfatase maturation enzyme AslB (radical SAM superfamily)|nr:hypothetical protein [Planctomycetaceae bacterium]